MTRTERNRKRRIGRRTKRLLSLIFPPRSSLKKRQESRVQYLKNRAKRRAQMTAYRKAHPEVYREANRRYRERQKSRRKS